LVKIAFRSKSVEGGICIGLMDIRPDIAQHPLCFSETQFLAVGIGSKLVVLPLSIKIDVDLLASANLAMESISAGVLIYCLLALRTSYAPLINHKRFRKHIK
jgi:hypothetical protein